MSEQATRPSVTVSLRMPVETIEAVRALATKHERSFGGEVRVAVRKHLEAQGVSARS